MNAKKFLKEDRYPDQTEPHFRMMCELLEDYHIYATGEIQMKKPKKDDAKASWRYNTCPKCKNMVHIRDKYCGKCGRKIIWT